MITGAHMVLYTENPEADRAFFRDILRFPFVDAGNGWLLFALPPAEAAFHPADRNGGREFYLMCDDVQAEVAALAAKRVACEPLTDAGWGLVTQVVLPGGGQIGLYQPKHPTAIGGRL
jgi:catechol 2,3-dioxygenase-like lactoylglutathione lyase family enzyme